MKESHLEEELFEVEQKRQEVIRELLFINWENCEKTEVHKRRECEAAKIARKLLNYYVNNLELYRQELSKHLIKKDAEKITKVIKRFEEEKGIKLEELIKASIVTERVRELYDEIFERVFKLLHTDRKDESGMRNEDWLKIRTVKDIPIPNVDWELLDYLIGQDEVKEVMEQIAYSGVFRNIEMLGPPGVGKSLAAEGLSQLLFRINPLKNIPYNYKIAKKFLFLSVPRKGALEEKISGAALHIYYEREIMPRLLEMLPHGVCDQLAFYNTENPERPFGRILPPGWGNKYREEVLARQSFSFDFRDFFIDKVFFSFYALFGAPIIFYFLSGSPMQVVMSLIVSMGMMMFIHIFLKYKYMFSTLGGEEKKQKEIRKRAPVVLVSNESLKIPFVVLDSSNAIELLGTTEHYAFGATEALPHEALRAGKVHEANGGVLYIDEAEAVFNPNSPDYKPLVAGMRSAMEDRKYGISHHGTTQFGGTFTNVSLFNKLPTRFMLIVAGNKPIPDPAVRNRMFSRGYTVYMNEFMPDTPENRRRTLRFIRQWMEIEKKRGSEEYLDMSIDAALEILNISKILSSKSNSLTVLFRTLGAYIMAANDIARREGSKIITRRHVKQAFNQHVPMELQELHRMIEINRPYKSVFTSGYRIGTVNGLAVYKATIAENLGIGEITPVEASLVEKDEKAQQLLWIPKKFREIAEDSFRNVRIVFQEIVGKEADNYHFRIYFKHSYGTIDGDSAGITMLAALISAYAKIPVDQSIAVTGSIDTKGYVNAVGGIKAKIEAAKEWGIKKVIIPEKNKNDVGFVEDIEVVYGSKISDYLIKHGLLKFDENNPKHKEIKKRIYEFERENLTSEYGRG